MLKLAKKDYSKLLTQDQNNTKILKTVLDHHNKIQELINI